MSWMLCHMLVTASTARPGPGSAGALQAARRGTVVSQLTRVHRKFENAVEVLRTKCVWSMSGKTAYSGRSGIAFRGSDVWANVLMGE